MWSLRDGVQWAYLNNDAGIEGFRFTAWFRAEPLTGCVPNDVPGKTEGSQGCHYDVELNLKLHRTQERSNVAVIGEHTLSSAVYPSSSRLPGLRLSASFVSCALLGTVTLSDSSTDSSVEDSGASAGASAGASGGASGGGLHASAMGTTAVAMRATHPSAASPEEWCTHPEAIDAAKATLGQQSDTGGTDHHLSLANEPSACVQMAISEAINAVHIRYFLDQQQEERRLLDGVASCLCSPPSSTDSDPPPSDRDGDALDEAMTNLDEATYQARLELMLRPWRMAVRLHIHTAFLAKTVCAHNTEVDRRRAQMDDIHNLLQLPSYGQDYFNLQHGTEERLRAWLLTQHLDSTLMNTLHSTRDDDAGWDDWLHLLSPFTAAEADGTVNGSAPLGHTADSVDPQFLPDQPSGDTDFCPLPILHHEPWNVSQVRRLL